MTATLDPDLSDLVIPDDFPADITIGSLCTGYGGLSDAVRSVIGGRHVWVADNDPDAAKLLAYRYPDIPNLGDVTQVDWSRVLPPDVIEFGFPCQDISQAGGRAGLREDTRSGNIWAHCFRAVAELRPSLVVIENVRSLTSADADSDLEFCPECMGDGSDHTMVRALGVVLGDLAGIFYDAQGCCVRASDAGAPHRRDRMFILAWPASDAGGGEFQRRGGPGVLGGPPSAEPCEGDQRERPGDPAGDRGAAVAVGTGSGGPAGGGLAADTFSEGLEVRPVEHHGPECTAAERGSGELPGPDSGLALLKTPTAQLAVNGGSQHPDKRRAGGHGPTLADQVEHELALLPTPVSTLGSNADAISKAKGRERGTLVEALSLLPTLTVAGADGTRAARGGDRSDELLLTGIAREVALTVDWGKYEAAVRRWERISGVPVPCPVRQGKTNYVLAPEFPEWMMGLQPGWVTGVPGLTRTAMLKLIGNGVVIHQGALAIRVLLDAIGWLPLRNLPAARALPDHRNPEKESA
jgi:DNA (cytosine-5)-methyltransferase 1